MPYKDPNDPRKKPMLKRARDKYRASEKGKAYQKLYDASPEQKARKATWACSPAGEAAKARNAGHCVRPKARAWMLEQQGGACAYPNCDRDATEVDHDHETGHVRGMLCAVHNTGLGKLGDNAAGLLRGLQYLNQ